MAEGFIRISSYWSPEEANLAKLHLASYGVEAELEGEMMVRASWIDANAIGGVRLLVKRDDVDEAKHILERHDGIKGLVDETEATASEAANGIAPGIQPEKDPFIEDSNQEVVTNGLLGRMRPIATFLLRIWLGFIFLCLFWTACEMTSVYVVIPSIALVAYFIHEKLEATAANPDGS